MTKRRLRDAKPNGGASKASLLSYSRESGKFAKIISHDS
jgi:hypothetical protein